MNRTYQKLTNRFVATDKDGNEYQMQVWTTFIEWRCLGGESGVRAGMKELRANGEAANYVEKGKYQTIWGVDLTSTDPNCP